MPRALVLLHGFTQTGASWDGVRTALGGERYRPVLAPDLRGHGSAAHARPADIPGVLADVAALVAGLGRAEGGGTPGAGARAGEGEVAPGAGEGERVTLAGYSMGGRLALLFALAHPDRVERLIVLSASAGLADPEERAARKAADDALARDIEAQGIDAFADRWAALPLWEGQPRKARARADALRRAQEPAGLAASLRGCGAGVMQPVWDRLPELAMPVVYAAGARDERYLALAERMAAATPRAEARTIVDAGHAVTLEAPARVAALLNEGG